MTARLQILLFAFALSGCNCFVPVEECEGIRCFRLPDGGKRDGGLNDAGRPDGGRTDGGPGLDAGMVAMCAEWDGGPGVGKCAAITGYVRQGNVCRGDCVLSPIVQAGLFPTLAGCISCGCDTSKLKSIPPGQTIGPETFCDQLSAFTTLPRLLDEAFGGLDSGFDAGCVSLGAINNDCTLWRGTLGDAGFARACGATLVPYVSEVQCRIFL